jgi:clan AA aspartic protease
MEEHEMLTSSCVLPLPKRGEEKLMGITHVTVRIVNPADSQRYRNVDFLVDSGAIYTFIPKNVLQDIGINPHSRRSFVLANGEKFVRRVGSADIIYKKRRGAITVVFGEKGDFPLLGVTALEAVGLILDPVQRKLKPVALTA